MGYVQQLKTQKGYDFFEVSSAFQKAIRRGLEEEALYWAAELYFSNYDEYAWKRLRIMVSEDIGLGEPYLHATIHALYDNYNEIKKKRKGEGQPSERLFLVQAVVMAVRAPKSRMICNMSVAVFGRHPHEHKPIPDYALDRHTRRGKELGRDFKHFFDEGVKLENIADVHGEECWFEQAIKVLSDPNPNQLF
jgi:replication-associated recombination protein RarA